MGVHAYSCCCFLRGIPIFQHLVHKDNRQHKPFLQTIFYTLPLLCDAPREDLIPAEKFSSEAKDSRKLQYEVYCKKQELLEASCYYLSSTNVATCGSDTKSIFYQVSDAYMKCLVMSVVLHTDETPLMLHD